MESSASSKDSKRSLIWSHFTEIGSDNTNMIRSVCNHCKKELKCSGTRMTSSMINHLKKHIFNLFNKYLLLVTFETDDNYSIRNEKTQFAQH